MKINFKSILLSFSLLGILVFSCKKEEETVTDNAVVTVIDTTATTTSTTTTTTDTTNNTTTSSSVPSATTFKFAATGKDCGITDGWANQQHTLPNLIHLNTDKCNGETYRPTITLTFKSGQNITAGTYNVTTVSPAGANEFLINSSQYNYTSWDGTAGSVVVTVNSSDSSKIDIKLNSITMTNQNPSDTINPATDILTGYIIKI